jgi:ABC-type transport system involved in cytochrome c biogenesis ATPase subunit
MSQEIPIYEIVFEGVKKTFTKPTIVHINQGDKIKRESILQSLCEGKNGTIKADGLGLKHCVKSFQKRGMNFIEYTPKISLNTTVLTYLDFLMNFYNTKETILPCVMYFDFSEILHRKIKDISRSKLILLGLVECFFYNARFWFVNLDDDGLDEPDKDVIRGFFKSKISNNGMIFYQVKSGKSLDIEHEENFF